jgi:hypothetical protein
VVLQSSSSSIVPKAEPIDTPLRPTQYKIEDSFEDAITIDSDSEDEVPLEEANITSLAAAAEEGPIVADVEGAEKKVSPEEYLNIQLKQLQRTKCARDDALVAENQFLRQLA